MRNQWKLVYLFLINKSENLELSTIPRILEKVEAWLLNLEFFMSKIFGREFKNSISVVPGQALCHSRVFEEGSFRTASFVHTVVRRPRMQRCRSGNWSTSTPLNDVVTWLFKLAFPSHVCGVQLSMFKSPVKLGVKCLICYLYIWTHMRLEPEQHITIIATVIFCYIFD